MTKIGSGILTFQGRAKNDYIADSVSLILASGSIIRLNYTGTPDTIRSLTVDGVAQQPGVYGGATVAPPSLPEFAGAGTVEVTSTPPCETNQAGVEQVGIQRIHAATTFEERSAALSQKLKSSQRRLGAADEKHLHGYLG